MSSNDLPTESAPIRIFVVDDHPMMRAGLVDTISSQPDLLVAAEADDGVHALEAYESCRPDVTIMDIAMPRMDGVRALAAIRSRYPQARVIMLTTFRGDVQIRRAMELGASGFLLKSSVRKDLLDTIRAVHAGQRCVPPEVARELAEHIGHATLSEREAVVLKSAAAGNANKRIAVELGIAEETVKAHMRSILAKLDARDRTHAVTIAIKRGIITL